MKFTAPLGQTLNLATPLIVKLPGCWGRCSCCSRHSLLSELNASESSMGHACMTLPFKAMNSTWRVINSTSSLCPEDAAYVALLGSLVSAGLVWASQCIVVFMTPFTRRKCMTLAGNMPWLERILEPGTFYNYARFSSRVTLNLQLLHDFLFWISLIIHQLPPRQTYVRLSFAFVHTVQIQSAELVNRRTSTV